MLSPRQSKQQRTAQEQQKLLATRRNALDQFDTLTTQRPTVRPSYRRSRGDLPAIIGPSLLPILLVIAVFALTASTPVGLDARNVTNILNLSSITGLLSLALAVTLIAGYLDLSVISVMGLGGALFALSLQSETTISTSLILTMIACAAIGAVQGALVSYLRMPSYFVTLAGLIIGFGGVLLIFQNQRQFLRLPSGALRDFIRTEPGAIPISLLFFGLIVGIGQFILSRSALGDDLRSLGRGARTQMPEWMLTILVFMVSAVLSGAAGILLTLRLQSVSFELSINLLADALTAALIGGAMVGTGRGSLVAVAIAAVGMAAVASLISVQGWPVAMRYIISGSLIIVALAYQRFTASDAGV